MKRDLGEGTSRGGSSGGAASGYGSSKSIPSISKSEQDSSSMVGGGAGKGKLWVEEEQGGGMDELLAMLGYKVRSSDMADVAQMLEHLEMVMGTAQEDGISHLSSDTVHYNPSDLSGWVQTMLSELNGTPPPPINSTTTATTATTDFNFSNCINTTPPPSQLTHHQSSALFTDDSEYDLRAIPGVAAYPPPPQLEAETENSTTSKRIKPNPPEPLPSPSSSSVSEAAAPPRPVVLIDSQETGIRLVHTLLACAEAVQQENLKVADALIKHIGLLAASQVGAMRKVATYFAEALARRIYKIYPQDTLDPSYSDTLEMHFYETSPYLKFAHFTANQAILEAFATSTRVHVVDFGLKQGMQWPALMQALALRSGGPPAFRLTGIGPPQPNNQDNLQQVGWKLAQFAQSIGVEFEFRGFMASSLADLQPEMLGIRSPEVEALAVNSVFELHRLLGKSGGMEKVLSSIKSMRPKIVTVVEQEVNDNSQVFLDRFTEALHYYSSLFDSLEGPPSQDLVMSELYLGRQICNVVACEGSERVERHETLTQWQSQFESAGLEPVHLGSNAFKQASMLLALFAGGDGYGVDEKDGCLMLGWHSRPLITTSAWKLAGGGGGS